MAGDRIRILHWGDSPTASTGAGTVARGLLTRLRTSGEFDLASLGIHYRGDPHEFEGQLTIFPVTAADPFGIQRIGDLVEQWHPDVLWTVLGLDGDPVLASAYRTACRRPGGDLPWLIHGPLDRERPRISLRDRVARAVSPCQADADAVRRSIPGLEVPVVPPAVDTQMFHPPDAPVRDEIRKRLGLRGEFTIVAVGANRERSQHATLLRALREIRRARLGGVCLLVHAEASTREGYDLRSIATQLGVEDAVVFTQPHAHPGGVPSAQLAAIYGAGDVAVFPGGGSSFGLCPLEAMACGVPVITLADAITAEVVRDGAGLFVPAEPLQPPRIPGTHELALFSPGGAGPTPRCRCRGWSKPCGG